MSCLNDFKIVAGVSVCDFPELYNNMLDELCNSCCADPPTPPEPTPPVTVDCNLAGPPPENPTEPSAVNLTPVEGQIHFEYWTAESP